MDLHDYDVSMEVYQLYQMYHSGEDVDNGGGCACEGRTVWEISMPSAQCCCAPKFILQEKAR